MYNVGMSSPRFTPRQLDAFIAAAELSNFTAAAHRLNLTPSAVSNLITELEAGLGFALFERTTRKVLLTRDGRDFLPAAILVQRQLSSAAQTAKDVRNRASDVVNVAAPNSVGAVILPPLIAAHRAENPRVRVRILDTGVEWLADRVATGEADIALGPDRVVSGDVHREALYPSPWVVWCSPQHPLAAQDELAWSDLIGHDFYAVGQDHEHSVYPRLLDHPTAAAVAPVQVLENVSTAFGIVTAGLGITCTPAYTEGLARTFGLVMRPLTEPTIIRQMSLYTPVRRDLSQAAQRFVSALREELSVVGV